MARIIGTHPRDYNNEVTIRKPIDARTLVPTYTDLLVKDNWVKAGTTQVIAYNGLVVSVADTTDTSKNGIYFLFDPECTSALKSPDVTDEANWHKIGESAENIDISEIETKIEEILATLNGVEDSEEAGLIATVNAHTTEIASLVSASDNYVTNDTLAATLNDYAKSEVVVTKEAFNTFKSENEAILSAINDNLDNKADLTTLKDYYKTADAEARFTTVEQSVTTLQNQVTTIQGKANANSDSIADLITAVKTNTTTLEGIDTKIDTKVADAVAEAVKDLETAGVTVATENTLGGIKSSTGYNRVSVSTTGIATVDTVNVNTLVQTAGDMLILYGGNSQNS